MILSASLRDAVVQRVVSPEVMAGMPAWALHRTLFSLDIATKEQNTIGDISKDFTPASFSNTGIRLSLSPDGKSILYPALRRISSLWMMEGFDGLNWRERLREILPW